MEESIFDIHEKKELWKKWAIKLFYSFGEKTREKVKTEFSDKPFKELINTALLELNKYSSSIIGDEVVFMIFRTTQTR